MCTRTHTRAPILPLLPTFEMQAARVSHRAHLPVTHSRHLNWHAGPLSISPLPFSRSLCASPFTVPWPWSKTALWHRVRHPGDRKHQTGPTEQLTKREEGDWHRGDVCKSLNARECVCDKQMNKLTQPERERRMTLSLPSARRWKVGRCPSEVRFCTDLKEEGRAWIRAAV